MLFYNLLCGYICPFRTTFQPETGAARGNIFSSQPAPVTIQYYYNPKNMQEEVWIHARERKTILKNKRKNKRIWGFHGARRREQPVVQRTYLGSRRVQPLVKNLDLCFRLQPVGKHLDYWSRRLQPVCKHLCLRYRGLQPAVKQTIL